MWYLYQHWFCQSGLYSRHRQNLLLYSWPVELSLVSEAQEFSLFLWFSSLNWPRRKEEACSSEASIQASLLVLLWVPSLLALYSQLQDGYVFQSYSLTPYWLFAAISLLGSGTFDTCIWTRCLLEYPKDLQCRWTECSKTDVARETCKSRLYRSDFSCKHKSSPLQFPGWQNRLEPLFLCCSHYHLPRLQFFQSCFPCYSSSPSFSMRFILQSNPSSQSRCLNHVVRFSPALVKSVLWWHVTRFYFTPLSMLSLFAVGIQLLLVACSFLPMQALQSEDS